MWEHYKKVPRTKVPRRKLPAHCMFPEHYKRALCMMLPVDYKPSCFRSSTALHTNMTAFRILLLLVCCMMATESYRMTRGLYKMEPGHCRMARAHYTMEWVSFLVFCR